MVLKRLTISFPAPQSTFSSGLQPAKNRDNRVLRGLLFIVLAIVLLAVPAYAGNGVNASAQPDATVPAVVHIGVYVVDFNQFSIEEGTYETNFYLDLTSNANVSLDDFEFMNGQVSSVETITDTPRKRITGFTP